MNRISNIEAAVLGLICEGPQYGYKIEKIVEERGMRNWTEIGFSSIYYVLKRLENKGLIQSKLEKVEGKPPRKVYTVTEEGIITMKEKVKFLLSKNKKLISPFDLGIAYLKLLEPEEVFECLKRYIDSVDERINFLRDSIDMMERTKAPYHVIALFSRPLAHMKTEKKWVEKFMDKIKKEENMEENK